MPSAPKMSLRYLSPPPNFVNASGSGLSDLYFPGAPVFNVREVHLSSSLRRFHSGKGEDIALAAFAVIAICLLNSIIFSVLLQRRFPNSYRACRQTLRLVCDLCQLRTSSAVIQRADFKPTTCGKPRTIIGALFLVVVIFTADIGFILLTTSVTAQSNRKQYGLRGLQPVGASSAISPSVLAMLKMRPCVSPVTVPPEEMRNFVLSVCINVKTENVAEHDPLGDRIRVASWYHRGGYDHIIKADELTFSFRLRALLTPTRVQNAAFWLLFDNIDSEAMEATSYLHRVFAREVLRCTCEFSPANSNCRRRDQIQQSSNSNTSQIWLWDRKGVPVFEQVSGLASDMSLGKNITRGSLEKALWVLASSAVIQEVQELSSYERADSSEIVDGIDELVSERVRICGVPLYAIIDAVFLVFLLLLRVLLSPASFWETAGSCAITETEQLDDRDEPGQRAVGAETGEAMDESYGGILKPF